MVHMAGVPWRMGRLFSGVNHPASGNKNYFYIMKETIQSIHSFLAKLDQVALEAASGVERNISLTVGGETLTLPLSADLWTDVNQMLNDEVKEMEIALGK